MKRSRFSVEQIVAVLRHAEVRFPVAELIGGVGISEQAFFCWKKPFTGLAVDQGRELKQLQVENAGRKRRVVDLTLDKAMRGAARSRKYQSPRGRAWWEQDFTHIRTAMKSEARTCSATPLTL